MENMSEVSIEWVKRGDHATISAYNGSPMKNKILKLAEKNPYEVKIVAINQDGSICANVPISYIKVSPKRRVSEEQKQAASERLRNIRLNQDN